MKTLRYKYRIYPNKEQAAKLNQFCGAQRFIWNWFLDHEQITYNHCGMFSFQYDNSKIVKILKSNYSWLNSIPSTSIQQTLISLDRALKQSFSKKKGFPKFKRRKFNQGSFTLVMVSEKHLSEKHIKVPKIGDIRIKLHRSLPSDFRSYTIYQKAGKWFISFVVKKHTKEKVKSSSIKKGTGYDLNSKHISVSSNGEFVENPKFIAKTKRKLTKIQRQFSKKKKGSNNWKKQLLKIQRYYDKITNQRNDFLNKLSFRIVNENDIICLENLNVKGMSKFNGSMVNDAGWSSLRSMIEFKAEMNGKHVSIVDRFFPSSKLCNNCGTIHTKQKLSERMFTCDCGISLHRDHNAAINILLEGCRIIGQGLPEFTLVDNPLTGDFSVERHSNDWLTQEATEALA